MCVGEAASIDIRPVMVEVKVACRGGQCEDEDKAQERRRTAASSRDRHRAGEDEDGRAWAAAHVRSRSPFLQKPWVKSRFSMHDNTAVEE